MDLWKSPCVKNCFLFVLAVQKVDFSPIFEKNIVLLKE